jgi:hypothetical protein
MDVLRAWHRASASASLPPALGQATIHRTDPYVRSHQQIGPRHGEPSSAKTPNRLPRQRRPHQQGPAGLCAYRLCGSCATSTGVLIPRQPRAQAGHRPPPSICAPRPSKRPDPAPPRQQYAYRAAASLVQAKHPPAEGRIVEIGRQRHRETVKPEFAANAVCLLEVHT